MNRALVSSFLLGLVIALISGFAAPYLAGNYFCSFYDKQYPNIAPPVCTESVFGGYPFTEVTVLGTWPNNPLSYQGPDIIDNPLTFAGVWVLSESSYHGAAFSFQDLFIIPIVNIIFWAAISWIVYATVDRYEGKGKTQNKHFLSTFEKNKKLTPEE